MIAGLRSAGIEVIECHAQLWTGIEDRVQAASGGWLQFSFLKRVFSTYRALLSKYATIDKNYDVMVLGYPGQLDVFMARMLSWWHGKPLVLDLFMSIYLIAIERGLDKKSSLSITILRLTEKIACYLPDMLICDTNEYVAWHHKTHGLPQHKFRLVPTGADDRVFRPLVGRMISSPFMSDKMSCLRVLYYGTFIPNHGVEIIIEAARLLRNKNDIIFELVGEGPTKAKAVQLANKYQLENVRFIDWIAKANLPKKMAHADVILGAFGTTPQSLMTVQNKIYEGLAVGKTVVTGDAPTIRETMKHGKHLYLCHRDAQSLAGSLFFLKQNPELMLGIAKNGHDLYRSEFTIFQLGTRFCQHLMEVINSK
ncbi:MAG: hypothetical protein B6242_14335 [Anaerolineaceae bacterium 4572_78]|nr:MAG: hypothetical protein B6242_14335 [Anaerolineaceae bacterium 4572_78]